MNRAHPPRLGETGNGGTPVARLESDGRPPCPRAKEVRVSSDQRGIFLVDADRAIATALREALVGTKLGLHWVSEIAAARRFLAAQRR